MPATPPPISLEDRIDLPWDKLDLDAANPRLAESGYSIAQQDQLASVLWKECSVNELVDSILANGYWDFDPLFAISGNGGRWTVLEGNRRLTAVRVIMDKNLRKKLGVTGIPDTIPKRVLDSILKLPVIPVKARKAIWEFIGFKHVNGPQEWDSVAKAQYIAMVKNEFGVSLDEIARVIGDRHTTVKRLYRGWMVLEQAEQSGVFDRADRKSKRFSFSHLWTGLAYPGFQSYLKLNEEASYRKNPVPPSRVKNLGDLCVWLYGSKSQGRDSLIRSQNPDLRHLDEVLSSEEGLVALRSGLPLSTAHQVSRGDEKRFQEALLLSEENLKTASGLVVTGYAGEPSSYDRAKNMKRILEGLLTLMKDIQSKSPHGR